MKEKIYEQTLLYDFYGELLNTHQRTVYEDAVFNDLSLSEIAIQCGISRQAAHDMIKRVDALLSGYEQKLRMIERYKKIEKLTADLKKISAEELPDPDSALHTLKNDKNRVLRIADDIMTALY